MFWESFLSQFVGVISGMSCHQICAKLIRTNRVPHDMQTGSHSSSGTLTAPYVMSTKPTANQFYLTSRMKCSNAGNKLESLFKAFLHLFNLQLRSSRHKWWLSHIFILTNKNKHVTVTPIIQVCPWTNVCMRLEKQRETNSGQRYCKKIL